MNENVKVGVVVLNFNNYVDTEKCVDSVLKQRGIDLKICIVDNGSSNDSYSVLLDRYENIGCISVKKSDLNLGYAKGNNIGIQFLRKLGCKYIFVANSDTQFSTCNILQQLVRNDETEVGILVPIIRNLDGSIENRVAYKKKLFPLRMIKYFIRTQMETFFKARGSAKATEIANLYKEKSGLQHDIYVVSGSGFMLTDRFLNIYGQLFPETFLYGEEWATMIYLYKAGLFSKIVPTDIIVHKGAASTPKTPQMNKVKNSYKAQSARKVIKLVFMSKNNIVKEYGV